MNTNDKESWGSELLAGYSLVFGLFYLVNSVAVTIVTRVAVRHEYCVKVAVNAVIILSASREVLDHPLLRT